ncbi:hypothetical protein N7490_006187 [Penicillium lividum]|nr:hypothetical protein N7490_006187 [Penicillium lividum]
MEYTRFSILPITATIRRRLPRLYSSHRADAEIKSGPDRHGLASLSEPQVFFGGQLTEQSVSAAQRPSTGDSLDSFASRSGSDTPPLEESSPAKYETESGLRWNRVVPAYNLLRNAGYEAQQHQADGRLARSLYINALMYLLDALPSDLTAEETAMLQYRLPEDVKSSIATSSQPCPTQLEDRMSQKAVTPPRSYLHRLLASMIVQIFLLARFLLPYFRLLLRQLYEYERSHHITQRVVTATLDAADGLGKKGVDISSAVCRLNQGRVGVAVANLASWCVEGVAGGIYEGVGEGMMHLDELQCGDAIRITDKRRVVLSDLRYLDSLKKLCFTMSTTRLPCIPSLRKQQLHLEFSSLRNAAPPGVYVSLAPGDPTLWSGVIFVRSGPYASAILRFQVRFPDIYPDLPPLVTFATDVFHPLIVPLTTYTFSTSSASDNPVSATDDERLPPGGFSLRHGFPHWFGRAKRSGLVSGTSSRNVSGKNGVIVKEERAKPISPSAEDDATSDAPGPVETEEVADIESPRIAQIPSDAQFAEARNVVPVAELLDYIRSTFDNESVLDSLPVEVAGNPGAWHAWKAHRRGGDSGDWKKGSPQARQPGDWHWDGIWAKRVQVEIEASHSDPMLFGGAARGGGDEMIRFSRLDDATMGSVKEKMNTHAYKMTNLRGSHGGFAVAAAAVIVEESREGFDRTWKARPGIERPKSPTWRSNMNRPLPVSIMSRGFPTDEIPGPLTFRKRSVSRSHSTISFSSYPQIPSRSSSLSAGVSDGSYGPASSTRTPSLSESQYQIDIVKVRQLGQQDANMEDPFVDNTPRRADKGQWNRRMNPRLVVRWSSGSWDSSRTCYPSEAGGSCAELTSEMEAMPNYLRPIDLPIAFVNVRAATSTLHIGKEPTSLWTTVYVSADVSPTPLLGTSSTAPLDIVILLDSLWVLHIAQP